MKRQLQRSVAVVLLTILLANCYSWRAAGANWPEMVATEQPTSVRVTSQGGLTRILDQPEMQNDSLVGMSSSEELRLARHDVIDIEVRRFNTPATIGLLIGIPLGLAVVGGVVFLIACDGNDCIGS